MIQPDPIHQDPSHQRMIPLDEMPCVSEPAPRGGQRGVLFRRLVSLAFWRGNAEITRSDRFCGLTMVAAMEDFCRRQHSWNLIEHADEIFDWLLRAFGGNFSG